MQALFAFEQCREANYQLAKEYIASVFQPDLNSMEVQDKVLLQQQREAALQHFEKVFKHETPAEAVEEKITETVRQALSQYEQRVEKDVAHFRSLVAQNIEHINQQFTQVLQLFLWAYRIAQDDKKYNHTNFLQNRWMKALRSQKETPNLWHEQNELLIGWFIDWRDSPEYKAYAAEENPTEESDKNFIKFLYRRKILGEGAIHDFLENEYIGWYENQAIIKSMLDKTIKSLQDDSFPLPFVSLDVDDDRYFVEMLYQSAVFLPEELRTLIAQNTRQFDVERLPLTDRIIIEMAIAEMVQFPSIPIKVTLNEYIELSKEYSTPNSRQFINGIVDVISKKLIERGIIKKSGRGLIDNR